MNDRKLLELAAKAAGYHYHGARIGHDYENCYVSTTGNTDDWFVWSPLADDGDTFRLMVLKRMQVNVSESDAMTTAFVPGSVQGEAVDFMGDPQAATRRAVVRAVAMADGQGGA